MFCAILDAAVWKPGERMRFKAPMIFLAICYATVILPFTVFFMSNTRYFYGTDDTRLNCINNMRQIIYAIRYYEHIHGHLPPAYTVDEDGKPLHSWRVLILPHLEERKLYDQIRLNEPWDSEYNQQFHSQVPRIFQCRTARWQLPVSGGCHYSIIYGAEAAFSETEPKKCDEKQHADTIFLAERKIPVNWMNPTSEISFETACEGINVNAMGISSFHQGKACCAFGDTGVRFLSDDTDGATLRAMLTFNSKTGE
jgi:hypothetical protein